MRLLDEVVVVLCHLAALGLSEVTHLDNFLLVGLHDFLVKLE